VTYANVTATLALFLALGGGAYAAATLPARSVGSKQLKRNAVVGAKIKNSGSKVKNNSLTGADVRESSLRKVPSAAAADNATTAGQATTSNSATTAGHATSAGALDKATYKSADGTAPPGSTAPVGTATATCDAGQHVVGGGVKVADPSTGFVEDTYPEGNTGWTGRVFADGSAPASFTVYAICTTFTAVG
jgi:hypothetical protein